MTKLHIGTGLSLPVEAVTQTSTPQELIAWAAGLFEGEGCIAMTKQKRGTRRALFVASTDFDVLEKFRSIVGAGVMREMKVRGNRKRAWRWEVQKWSDVERIGRLLLPHLCSRRREKMRLLFSNPPTRRVGRCHRGHPLVGPDADVYLKSGRTPRCAICARARTAAWHKKQKERT
jgi:hypothetical protein